MKTQRVHSAKKLLAIAICYSVLLFNCVNTANSQQDDNNAAENKRFIKIALLLDTSNSMDGLIEQAKSQLWSIVNELAKAKCDGILPELQIALYEYGNDNLSMSEGYVRMVTPLTSDLDQISADLFKLTTNGGSEFCGKVIQTSMKQLDWSTTTKDLQLIFIAGNEPFTQGNVNYDLACKNAKEKSVVVNTIYCGNFDEGIRTSWKNGADITGGKYFSIEQNRKTVFIESPYDDRIAELNTALNKTYIAYGSKGKSKMENQRAQDANSAAYGKANVVKRTVSKSSHVYNNKSWDLVDASKEKDFKITGISEQELPEELKNMNDEEKAKYINNKAAERSKIQAEINELNKKRLSYITENSKNSESNEGMLDIAILSAIKDQAAQKNYLID